MRKRFKESEIINLLRAIEVKISEGMSTEVACRSLGVSDKSYYRWRKLYGSMGRTEIKRCKDLEKENQHASKKVKVRGGTTGKQAVLGMRERGGRVKAMAVPNTKSTTLQQAIRENVEEGSTVFTDEKRAYRGIIGSGKWPHDYNHMAVCHSAKEYVNGQIHTNGIESVWALLKRGYIGTFHHFSMKHCQRYVDEFAFRLNEGNCERDAIDRIKSVCAVSVGKRLTYKELVAK